MIKEMNLKIFGQLARMPMVEVAKKKQNG